MGLSSSFELFLGKRKSGVFSKKVRTFIDSISSTALVKYKATSRFENVVKSIVYSCLQKQRHVLLVSSAPRIDIYAAEFKEEFEKGLLKLVKISSSTKTDRFYLRTSTETEDKMKGKVAEISVNWLEYLSEVVEGLPKKSVLIFEPITDLILIIGFEKAFKFIKKTIDYSVNESIPIISFMNAEAHEEKINASFEGLFTNIASISEDSLEIIK
jgi:hypothetical protein